MRRATFILIALILAIVLIAIPIVFAGPSGSKPPECGVTPGLGCV